MDTATVSVVIPTRNRPRLLEMALESLRRQTRAVDQVVVVDDGSSPDHVGAIRELTDSWNRTELFRHDEPRGPSASRNLGLAHASGSHVLFLDDDDLIHPEYLETGLAAFAERPEADVVVFRYECFFVPESFEDGVPVAMLFDYRCLADSPLRHLGSGNPSPIATLERTPVSSFLRYLIPVHSCLVRRRALGDTRFPVGLRQGEDTYFWISIASRGARFVGVPHVYAYVRRHRGNATRSRHRYAREIQGCYEALLDDGLLRDPADAFLAHLKLFWFRMTTGEGAWSPHLRALVGAPRLFVRELGFWARNLRARRQLLRYYFRP